MREKEGEGVTEMNKGKKYFRKRQRKIKKGWHTKADSEKGKESDSNIQKLSDK